MTSGRSGADAAARVDLGEWLFLLLVASLPVMRPVWLEIRRYAIPPADFIFVFALVAAAGTVVARRKSLPRSGVLVWLALYAAAMTVSAAMSTDRGRSAIKLIGNFYLIGLAALTMFQVQSVAALRRALMAWVAGTIVTIGAACVGLGLFLAGVTDPSRNLFLSIHGSLPEGSYPRVMGLFLNPNMYCAYLVTSLAIVMSLRQVAWMTRRMGMALALALVFAASWSLSPGLGGLLLVAAFGAWTRWRVSRPRLVRATIAASLAGASCFLLAISGSPLPGAPFRLRYLRASSRALAWVGALQAFPSHPWFGKGPGLEVVEIGYRNSSGIYELLTDAHNAWLSILVQCGVLGLAAFVALIVALLRGTTPLSFERPLDCLRSGLTVAFIAGFLYQSLSGSFENTRHVWVLMGLLAAVKELRTVRNFGDASDAQANGHEISATGLQG